MIVGAFDAAWQELSAEVGADRGAIERARKELAGIVLGLARVGPIEHSRLTHKAVIGYRIVHGDASEQLAACADVAALVPKAPRGER